MMRVYLTGFMGAGKTSVGKCLARELGVPFLDLDREIERSSGATIPEIFARGGEEGFRSIERQALERTLEVPDAVIATGGGTVTVPANQKLLRESGVSVWLNPHLDDLLERLGDPAGPQRPLFESPEQAAALYRSRLPSYETADLRVDVDEVEDPPAVARRIRHWLEEAQ